ncbi:energy-coupling factor transporter transmembrane component T [Microbacterium sp. 10M-3C3]|jgi:energy-coupling factor transport system permease protein|uniref:energy-coupling factor transporter transmembrane component T family protein n=1 Tax=Microbacterium sp. 10M-3C3 TaxID=2483401 RepID=UPI000F62FAC9|nr:energy-coupling factor transporter transmembrane component T [Microbacterium sp. 10M-3C3]
MTPARGGALGGLNPLAKLAAPLPAMLVLVFVRDLTTPLLFAALAYAVLAVGARWSGRLALVLLVAVPVAVGVLGSALALWADAARLPPSPVVLDVGGVALTAGALEVGYATATRLGAIASLALIGGLTTSGADLVRSLVQQARVPYRIGYAALAGIRFVPRFGRELEQIRRAHRVRGARPGPLAALARGAGSVVPLLAGGIRHAERVALAMDARAFGAHPTRTERYVVPFRARDLAFMAGFWTLSAALLWATWPWGLA